MLKSLSLATAPFVVLLALMSGCSIEQTKATSPTPIPSLPTEPAPSPITSTAPSPLPQTDPFQEANDKAIGAATISQSAQSKDDWNLVASMWQEAITLMKAVPKSSSNYALTQGKVAEYQHSLAYAKQQAVKSSAPSDFTAAQEPADSSLTIQNFLESYFDQIINKGSSGQEYWCSETVFDRVSFYSPRSWTLLDTHLAPNGSGGSFTVRLESSNKGGMPIIGNWLILLEKEKNPTVAKNISGGWCITAAWEK